MPLVAWFTIISVIGGTMVGFVNCEVYKEWQAKSEAEQAAIIEAAEAAETDDAEAPEIIIITD